MEKNPNLTEPVQVDWWWYIVAASLFFFFFNFDISLFSLVVFYSF